MTTAPPGITLEDAPPEDRTLSPYTGWTRAHWEHAADALLAGAARYATPRFAQIHPPGGTASMSGRLSDGLEGFARTFLLAAVRVAGARGEGTGGLAERYASGLDAGTDPRSGETWPDITEASQPMVEAASVAIGLYETRPWIWDRLDAAVRTRVVDWLSQVHGKRFHHNNWLLFNVMVNSFLRSVGAPFRQDEIERNLDLIDSFYRRDGWYTDGPGQNYDHYVGWALHLYTILWARMGGDETDPARASEYRRRLRAYLEDYRHLFAADGAPLHQGRSLIYRFAAAAPSWAGALAGATPLAPGETRRIASGCVRHFLDRGAVRDGVLTMGWYDEFLPAAQRYSGPGSPYWASKGFLGLLLPPDAPEWTHPEQPLPVERGDFVRAMPEPGFVASGTRADGIVRVASHRSDRYPWVISRRASPVYRALAYSTHTGPEIGDAGDEEALDSQVSLTGPDDHTVRGKIHTIAVGGRFAASVQFPDEADAWYTERIETATVVRGPSQVRIHHVSTPHERGVREGGFAVAGDRPPGVSSSGCSARARTATGLVSAIHGLHGYTVAGVAEREGQNAYGRFSATPWVAAPGPVGAEGVYVSLVVLTEAGDDGDERDAIAAVEVHGHVVRIGWTDGDACLVQLVAPEPLDEPLGDAVVRGSVRFAWWSRDEGLVVV